MNKRTTKKIQPKQVLNSEQKDDNLFVSPAIANAHVIGSQSTSLSTEKDKKYLQLKKILKGMSLHDAAFFLYECRGRLEKESKIG